jgi:hypothetical protein
MYETRLNFIQFPLRVENLFYAYSKIGFIDPNKQNPFASKHHGSLSETEKIYYTLGKSTPRVFHAIFLTVDSCEGLWRNSRQQSLPLHRNRHCLSAELILERDFVNDGHHVCKFLATLVCEHGWYAYGVHLRFFVV